MLNKHLSIIAACLNMLTMAATNGIASQHLEDNHPPMHGEVNRVQGLNRFLATLPGSVSLEKRQGIQRVAIRERALILNDLGLETIDGSTLGNLTWLTELHLNNNKLQELPDELGCLQGIRILDVRQNSWVGFPLVVTKLRNLEELYLGGNELPHLGKFVIISYEHRRISGHKFQSLPSEIGQMTNLKLLELDYGILRFLPLEIGLLTKLETLSLMFNNLQELPKEVGKLCNLKRLRLQVNPLLGLPEQIGQLTSLEYLSINFSQRITLPTSMKNLNNIQEVLAAGEEILPHGKGRGLGQAELRQLFGRRFNFEGAALP
jgi:Leucine-rich repeat (LRR) protein